MYRINEIFYSLQGEGVHVGTPALFIRMSGCNRSCPFCDTEHQNYTPMTLAQIMDRVAECPAEVVILTGGEPAMQTDAALVEALHQAGKQVHIETNGSLPLPDGIDWVTCSPKDGPYALTEVDELKVVLIAADPEEVASHFKTKHLLLQPCSCLNTHQAVEYCKTHPKWRLSLQTHKLIDIP